MVLYAKNGLLGIYRLYPGMQLHLLVHSSCAFNKMFKVVFDFYFTCPMTYVGFEI